MVRSPETETRLIFNLLSKGVGSHLHVRTKSAVSFLANRSKFVCHQLQDSLTHEVLVVHSSSTVHTLHPTTKKTTFMLKFCMTFVPRLVTSLECIKTGGLCKSVYNSCQIFQLYGITTLLENQ